MKYPKIYLTLDNCFAIKRWVEPETWGPLIKDLGFRSIEASFDNEIDFLYSPQWYLDEWFERLKKIETQYDLQIDNFFTGYQTYRTAGLAHPNDKMAEHLLLNFIKPAIERLGKRGNRMGFSMHALPDNVIQDPKLFKEVSEKVICRMAKIGRWAKENGNISICVEAMYVPYQTPWTIEGTHAFLRDIYAKGEGPIYTTIDVGHMTGQKKFVKPTAENIKIALEKSILGQKVAVPYLGADSCYALWDAAIDKKDASDKCAEAIYHEMESYSYLFSNSEKDSNPYAWLERLACYSPIIHMQQTDNLSASHAAFTPMDNEKGIINGKELLRAIAKSYEQEEEGMPPKAEKLYLSFEIFAKNTEIKRDIITKLKETNAYWRQFIPEDGIELGTLLKRLEEN